MECRQRHARAERHDEARDVLERAIQCCPDNKLYLPYLHVGYLHEYKGEYELAKKWFTKCFELNGSDADCHISLGRVLYQQENFDNAEQCFRHAIQCAKGNTEEAHYFLGLVLRSQEQFEDAGRCFGRALELNPDYAEAHTAFIDTQKARGV